MEGRMETTNHTSASMNANANADADAIAADVRAALAGCIAKGGAWRQIGEPRLGPVMSLVETVAAQLVKARDAAAPLLAAVAGASKSSGARMHSVHEDLWDALGKPASDATLSLLFPGGPAYYASGSTDEQPDRMELLAQLLEAGVHPKLAEEKAKAKAGEVRTAARSLRAAIDASRIPRARVRLLERAALVVVESARAELVLVKRRFKAEGFSDDEIESVLSARPAEALPSPSIPPEGLKLA